MSCNVIYVGDTVNVDFIDIGMSHRQRYVGLAVVTSVHPSLRVKPVGWNFDRSVSWSEVKILMQEVVENPELNSREALLGLAQGMHNV